MVKTERDERNENLPNLWDTNIEEDICHKIW